MFILCLDGFLLLGLILFLGFFHSLGFGFHGKERRSNTSQQSSDEDIGIRKHRCVEQLLSFFYDYEPSVMYRFGRGQCTDAHCLQALCGRNSHASCAVNAISCNQSHKDAADLLIVLNERRNHIQRIIDNALGLLADCIEHRRESILDI